MTLSSPLSLVVGLLVTVALGWAVVVSGRRRKAALAAAGVALAGGRRTSFGAGLTIAGVAVLAIATAGPTAMVPVPRTAGTVILAIDVSNSMGADDVAPPPGWRRRNGRPARSWRPSRTAWTSESSRSSGAR
ncbi:hypothetical protein GCM10020001_036080 [Nonomuraea salmonea]